MGLLLSWDSLNLANFDDAFLRLRALLRAIEDREGLDPEDSVAKDILQLVVETSLSDSPLRASDIALNARFGSPATIYKKLARLSESGWIKQTDDSHDGRVRLVVPTPKAISAFNRMAGALRKNMTNE